MALYNTTKDEIKNININTYLSDVDYAVVEWDCVFGKWVESQIGDKRTKKFIKSLMQDVFRKKLYDLFE